MKNVFGYIRVSTARQGEGVSLTVQKEAIERYATQYGLSIVRWFEEKETAAKLGRPLFNSMMKLLREKAACGVIIHKIDRSARNLKDWADLGNLIDQGVEVHFAHESLDLNGRSGRLSADIQAVIAADYIRNLRQEAIKGIYGRLNQGIYPFHAPIGYVNQGAGKAKTHHPVFAKLIRRAFELYATKKYTLLALAEYLSKAGLRNHNGSKIKVNGVSVILNNPFYIGVMVIKGKHYSGKHEPIVSPNLFNRVQHILKYNTNQKIEKHDFQFRKLLKCAECKNTLTGERQKGQVYYRCHRKKCTMKGIREVVIETWLLDYFKGVQLLPQEMVIAQELIAEQNYDQKMSHEELLMTLELQKGQLIQKLDRLADLYIDEGLDRELYENRKAKLLMELKEKESIENDLRSKSGQHLIKVNEMFELASNLIKSYEKGLFDERRELIEKVSSNLFVNKKNLIISMRSPFSKLYNRHLLSPGGAGLDELRKKGAYLVVSDVNQTEVIREPLSKECLKLLVDEVVQSITASTQD